MTDLPPVADTDASDADAIPPEVLAVPAAEDEPWDAVAAEPMGETGAEENAPTPAESDRAVLAALDALSETVVRRLDGLQALVEREGRAEATREKVVDRLHAELQDYKQDLLLNTMRPVFIDLIQLHDDIGKVAVHSDGDGASDDVRRLVVLMEGFQQGIEDVLYRQGVEPFQVEGTAFDPKRQRTVATVPSDDPSLNKTVAGRLRKGFRSGDRVIRPEVVSVYATRK